jgi:hypothetical protein
MEDGATFLGEMAPKRNPPAFLDFLYHLASFMPGIGLTLGYCATWIITQTSPLKQITVTDEVAVRYSETIGECPNWKFESEPDMGMSPINVQMPEMGADGKLKLKTVTRSVEGRGESSIFEAARTEIVVPSLGTPPVKVERRMMMPGVLSAVVRRNNHPEIVRVEMLTGSERSEAQRGRGRYILDYTPNFVFQKTGVYEVRRDVEFHPRFDQNSVSIWWAIVGTIAGLLIYVLRSLWGNLDS